MHKQGNLDTTHQRNITQRRAAQVAVPGADAMLQGELDVAPAAQKCLLSCSASGWRPRHTRTVHFHHSPLLQCKTGSGRGGTKLYKKMKCEKTHFGHLENPKMTKRRLFEKKLLRFKIYKKKKCSINFTHLFSTRCIFPRPAHVKISIQPYFFLSISYLSFPSFFLSFLSSLSIEEEERRDGEMKMNSIDNGWVKLWLVLNHTFSNNHTFFLSTISIFFIQPDFIF